MNDTVGNHIIAELSGISYEITNDLDFLKKIIRRAIRKSGVNLIAESYHRFNPQGISGVLLLAESHISFHTWPQEGYISMDIYTCGSANTVDILTYIVGKLNCKYVEYRHIQRGIRNKNIDNQYGQIDLGTKYSYT